MPNSSTISTIRCNLERVRETLAAAAERSGRTADQITLVAVTKYADVEWVESLLDLGELHLGENRPQQLVERAGRLPNKVHWHLIGHLQRNKVRPVLSVAEVIHSIDSLKLLDRVNRMSQEIGVTPRLLLEVNVSGEGAKDGFTADELREVAATLSEFEHVAIQGLMTMAPLTDDVEETRPIFASLRSLADELKAQSPRHSFNELSMGMSRDFTVAVEEGATIVRIGRTLYEGLERSESH